jgi:cytochrome bd-type quinol oxidase subunit 2
MLSEKTILYIAAIIVLIHIIIGFVWVFWKMHRQKHDKGEK